jgi:anti-sigma regulatory factor (Ser/Thr protein kinase)
MAMVMAVQAARVAAQLREAAYDVARIARRRAAAGMIQGIDPGRMAGGNANVLRGDRGGPERIPHPATQHGPDPAGLWPLRSFLELEPVARAVPMSRRHARRWLSAWALTQFSQATELVISELVTNAVHAACEHAAVAPLRLWLLSDEQMVLILVWDPSPQPPVLIEAGEEAENGRGLLLVDAICKQWSWFVPHDLGGKVVWAEITQQL